MQCSITAEEAHDKIIHEIGINASDEASFEEKCRELMQILTRITAREEGDE